MGSPQADPCTWCGRAPALVVRSPWSRYEHSACVKHVGALKRRVLIDVGESEREKLVWTELEQRDGGHDDRPGGEPGVLG